MHDDDRRPTEPARRSVLRGAAVAGLSLPLVAACGSDPGAPSAGHQAARRAHQTGAGKDSAAKDRADKKHASEKESHNGPKPLVSASQVPVGGGKILADDQIVVTQPKSGHYKAFSAVCTHMQCLVTMVQNGVIICPCHGSEFSIKDGSVVRGPAATALPPVHIEVEHGEVLPG